MLGLWFMGLVTAGVLYAIFDDHDDDDAADAAAAEAGPRSPEDQLIQGTPGDDTLDGGPGADRIFALEGDDLALGGEDDDRVFGAAGEDLILGEAGNDFLRGGADDDVILGGAGEDTVFGDVGDDVIDVSDALVAAGTVAAFEAGTVPQDVGDVADFDAATNDADTADGGVGNDLIIFGDNDSVTGGLGSDTFGTGYWASPAAPATVTDFDPNRDVLLYGLEDGTSPLIAFAEEDDGLVVLQVDGQTVVKLPGIDFFDLDQTANLAVVGLAQTT